MYMDVELIFPPSDFDVVYCLASGLCGPAFAFDLTERRPFYLRGQSAL